MAQETSAIKMSSKKMPKSESFSSAKKRKNVTHVECVKLESSEQENVKYSSKKKKKTKDSDQVVNVVEKIPGVSVGKQVEKISNVDQERRNKSTFQKKIKKKKNKKRKKESGTQDVNINEKSLTDNGDKEENNTCTAKTSALAYLRNWQDDRESWCFQKVRQVWLLQHVYHSDAIPDDDFPILLNYLEGLQGKARVATVKEAEKIMEDYETDEEASEGDDETAVEKKKTVSHDQMERSRKIIQLLS